MKVFIISPDPPPNIKNFVINHPFFQTARLINGKYHVSLRFKGSASAYMTVDTEQAAFAEAFKKNCSTSATTHGSSLTLAETSALPQSSLLQADNVSGSVPSTTLEDGLSTTTPSAQR